MSEITTKDFAEKLKSDAVCVIDVRTKDEFDYQAIPGAKCLPLDEINRRLNEIPKDQDVYVMCRSGGRSKKAVDLLRTNGFTNIINVQGGLQACCSAGIATTQTKKVIPLMRQVQMVAGFLVLLGVVLSHVLAQPFIYLSAFVGAGLMFAGLTGFCGLGELLLRMPWNKTQNSTETSCCN